MNRWEQAHQIWAGSVNPACVDVHTNQQRTEWECVFVTEKPSVPSNMMFQIIIFFISFKLSLVIAVLTGKTVFHFVLATCHMWMREMKDLIQQLKWRGSWFKGALWRIWWLLVGWGGGSERRGRVKTKSLQLVEEAQETSAPQCLLDIWLVTVCCCEMIGLKTISEEQILFFCDVHWSSEFGI